MPDVNGHNWEEVLDRELVAAGRSPHAQGAKNQGAADRELDGAFDHLRQDIFDGIRQGAALPVDICDENGRVLLPAGSKIDRDFLNRLRELGVQRVRFRHSKAEEKPGESPTSKQDDLLHTPVSRRLDERLAGELQRSVVFRPVKTWRRPRLPVTQLKERAQEALGQHAATADAVAELCESLAPGRRVSLDAVNRNVHQFVNMATADFDLLPLLTSLQHSQDEYLFDHCVNTSLMGIALASQLGLHREEVTTVALAGLLADVGMLRVPEGIRLKPGALTPDEWTQVKRHPLHTLDMLSEIRGLPSSIHFIVYQAHERMDGSGYPRARQGDQVHQFARLVALADVYAAMTRSRPHRQAHGPYETAKEILLGGASNKFDRPLIRALLDTVSLFPTGSIVDLSDGTRARVLRANPGLHTKPVVEQLSPDGTPTGHVIDLSKEEAPNVARAV